MDMGDEVIWLLIPSIALLLVSSLFSAYYASCLSVARHERPALFLMHEMFLICGSIVPFLAGVVMLFIATGWRWGLAGLGIYWLLVVFVLMPIAGRVRCGRFPGLRG